MKKESEKEKEKGQEKETRKREKGKNENESEIEYQYNIVCTSYNVYQILQFWIRDLISLSLSSSIRS